MAISDQINFKKPNLFYYKEVIDLGFERKNLGDSQFFNQNGYDWFIVTKKLCKGVQAEWDCETHKIELVRYDKESNVLGRMEITNREHLNTMFKFFGQGVKNG